MSSLAALVLLVAVMLCRTPCFAVFVEPFAVIAEEDDERAIVEAAPVELGEKTAQDRVGRGDLAVVGIVRVSRLERLDRLVRRMRLEKMKKEEERLLLDATEPVARTPGARRQALSGNDVARA